MLALALFAVGCGRAAPPTVVAGESSEAAALSSGWHMRATLAPGADALSVQMCFEGHPPPSVKVTNPDAEPHIEALHVVGRDAPLRMKKGRVDLAELAPGECMGYRVDFRRMATLAGGRSVNWVGDSVAVRQGMWLLWPTETSDDAIGTIELELPEGMKASVPWRRREGPRAVYELDATAGRWLGFTAFGELVTDSFAADGVQIELARLDAEMTASPEGLRRWILDAVHGVAMLYEGYPRERMQVLVVPIDGAGGSVYFGMAARGGGPGVMLLVNRHADERELPGGWTTVHELLHHGMPFAQEAWMSEGFVSYYTEIMRTRAGHRSEKDGWRELSEAFARGRRGGRGMTLAASSAHMMDTFAFQRVYWGGAAIAFALDIRMRVESRGKLGFDDAMRELRRCCGDAPKRWPAKTLLAKLDAWYGKPIFTEVATDHLAKVAFPDTEAMMRELGVTVDGDTVVLDESHPLADVRRTIMAPRE